jgi:hypothetical protein
MKTAELEQHIRDAATAAGLNVVSVKVEPLDMGVMPLKGRPIAALIVKTMRDDEAAQDKVPMLKVFLTRAIDTKAFDCIFHGQSEGETQPDEGLFELEFFEHIVES